MPEARNTRSASKAVIAALNEVLTGELTSINQYFLHARLCGHWGFKKLEARIYKESIDEMRHADQLIARILFLGGTPNVQRLGKINIGETVEEVLQSDLGLEHEALPRLNHAIELARQEGDNGTRALLEAILRSEEEHTDWIETQLELLAKLGAPAYLAEQLGE